MKSILLASASIIAFAGAAAAEVTFTGSAELGYNDFDIDDTIVSDDNDGFYADLELTIGFSAELDNGVTVAASIDLEDLAAGQDSGEDDGFGDLFNFDGVSGGSINYELSLSTENAALFYGDTSTAAENLWISAGDMEGDGFTEADGEEVLRGEIGFGNVDAQLSFVLANADGERDSTPIDDTDPTMVVADPTQPAFDTSDLEQLSLAVSADFGNFNVVAAYQDAVSDEPDLYNFYNGANGDFEEDEVFGISVGTTFGAADVRLAYATEAGGLEDESLGIQVSYPIGPVSATAYYVLEEDNSGSTATGGDNDNYGLTLSYSDDGPLSVTFDYDNDQEVNKYGLEGSYEVSDALVVYAGYLFIDDLVQSEHAFYLGGEYDLGAGASLLVSYAEGDDAEYEDEIGTQDYQEGTTVEISFDF